MRRVCFALVMVLAMTGCGFHPVYAPGQAARGNLPAIYVNLIPDRRGQLLRQELQTRLEGSEDDANKRYTLTVIYAESNAGLSVQQNNFSTYTRDIGTATWILHPADNPGQELAKGTVRSLDGYNVIDEQFFYQDLSEDAAQRRLAQALADQITLGVSLFFDRPQPAKARPGKTSAG